MSGGPIWNRYWVLSSPVTVVTPPAKRVSLLTKGRCLWTDGSSSEQQGSPESR